MKTNKDHKTDFENETCLHVAENLIIATKSWATIEDAGDESKARELHFNALGNNRLYMANADKTKPDFVRLYIVGSGNKNVWSVYVKKDILCPGERYHHVTGT